MQKIKKIGILIIYIFVLNSLFINCYATNDINKENINKSLQQFVSSGANGDNYQIAVSDNTITITVDEKSYILNYDLTEKPKFTLEIPIQQGMSYEDFKEQTERIVLPIVGYIAVANIQGVELEDASAYILMSYIGDATNGSWSSDNSYVIVDDTNLSDEVTIDKSESDSKTIYVSEFGERVMEYVNDIYKDKQTITDATNGIDSYEWIIEKKDVTETSCKLVSTLSVNTNADFSKIKGYANGISESFDKANEYDSNEQQQEQTKESKSNNIAENYITTKNTLPKAGVSNVCYVIIVFSFILLVIFVIKLRQHKDIK